MDTQRNQELDYLRAYAIILVMIFHLFSILAFNTEIAGFIAHRFHLPVGVDVFFAISGFVIYHSLHRTTAFFTKIALLHSQQN